MKVGFLGKHPVTFGYEAAQQLGSQHDFEGYLSHPDIYDAVRDGEVDCGVLAVENQLAGAVDETLHAVVQPIVDDAPRLSEASSHIAVVRELAVPVELYLMNRSGRIEDIEVVKTHPVPMRQARMSLDEIHQHRPFSRESTASTDAAAADAQAHPRIAAIASKLAPTAHRDLKIIRRIDDPIPGTSYENLTRFWVVERMPKGSRLDFDAARQEAATGTRKIALLFNLERDEPGGLARSLDVLSAAGINLASIYALPRRDRSWEYTFVVEFEVPAAPAKAVHEALKALGQVVDATLLGIYPAYHKTSASP